jgi:polar amino acid transport system substrate-binding protein
VETGLVMTSRRTAAVLVVLLAVVLVGVGYGSTTSASSTAHGLPALPAAAAARGKWVIGVKCDFYPFGYIDAKGHHAGYDVQVAQELAQLAFGNRGHVQYECVNTASRIPTLESGKVDMIIATLSWSKARAITIDYSTPYYGATGRLLVRAGGNVSSLADLDGKSVVTTTGSVYVTWTKSCLKGANLQEVSSPADALTALKDGRADAFMFDDAYLLGAEVENSGFTLTHDKFLSIPWGIGIRKGDVVMTTWVDAALARMTADDDFYRILKDNVPPSAFSSFSNQVPRPGITLRYPVDIDPVTNCAPDG